MAFHRRRQHQLILGRQVPELLVHEALDGIVYLAAETAGSAVLESRSTAKLPAGAVLETLGQRHNRRRMSMSREHDRHVSAAHQPLQRLLAPRSDFLRRRSSVKQRLRPGPKPP